MRLLNVFFGSFLLMLILFSFVSAVSSDVVAEFNVDVKERPVVDYVPSGKPIGSLMGYFVLVVIVLALAFFILRSKVPIKKKKVSSKKKTVKKKKKVSRK